MPDNTQSKADADALVEKLTAKFDEALKPVRDQIESLTTKWNKMEEEATRSVNAETAGKHADGTELTSEERNERDKRGLLAVAVNANARITESECIAGIASEWPQLVPKVKELFRNTDWQRKAQPDYAEYCSNIVDMLVGKEARKGGLRYDRTSSRFMIEDATTKTGGAESPLNDPDLTWVDPKGRTMTASDQLAKFKIDPEKFAKNLKDGRLA